MNSSTINKISTSRYGYDALTIDSTAALWLADHILQETGKNVYKRISNMRNKLGKGTMFPEYGTELFKTM
jgi:hypothetical protein